MADFFVEFEIADEDRFQRLVAVFDAVRAAKQSDDWQDDTYWLAFFDQEPRLRFWWPTAAEKEDWARRWFAAPVPQRFTDPTLVTPWDFGSMINAFRNGDYDLVSCERQSERIARLTFNSHGWPYGGTRCMRALLEAFGHRVSAEPED
jgi:hypothetical protein